MLIPLSISYTFTSERRTERPDGEGGQTCTRHESIRTTTVLKPFFGVEDEVAVQTYVTCSRLP